MNFFGMAMLLCASAIWGCGDSSQQPAAPPPAAVSVCRPAQREVIEWDEYTGHLESPGTVDVRARVSGMLKQASFKEGAIVKKGDVLFVIDEEPFKADLEARQADLERAKAQQKLASMNFERTKQAVASNAVSQQQLDTEQANLQQAEAAVRSADAAVTTAQLNLDWCTVKAEIAGRVSNKLVTEGNLVTAQTTLLTTITSIDPMYAYVDVDEASVLKYQRLAREKKRVSARNAQIPCFVQLGNEANFPHEGVVDFVDNHIDPNTGTIRARGVIPNPAGDLQPGMFARSRIPGSGRYSAMLVSEQAIGTLQNLKYLLVVGDDDTVQQRPVTLGGSFGPLRAIVSGLDGSERVIVEGLQKARPGAKVSPHEIPIPTEGIQLTAPGSPTTQALPATRMTGSSVERVDPNIAAAELHGLENQSTTAPSTNASTNASTNTPTTQLTNSPAVPTTGEAR